MVSTGFGFGFEFKVGLRLGVRVSDNGTPYKGTHIPGYFAFGYRCSPACWHGPLPGASRIPEIKPRAPQRSYKGARATRRPRHTEDWITGSLSTASFRAAFGWQGRVGWQVLRGGQVLDVVLWHDTCAEVTNAVVNPRKISGLSFKSSSIFGNAIAH
jgi:hypothetical protein